MGFNSASSESDGHEHMLSALNVTAAHGLKAAGVVQYGVGHGPGLVAEVQTIGADALGNRRRVFLRAYWPLCRRSNGFANRRIL